MPGAASRADAPLTEDDLVSAVETAAKVVVRHGVRYAPILECVEQELERVRAQTDVMSRARRIVEEARRREAG